MPAKIFEDQSRPFYKLCHRMIIQRISEQHYIKFLNTLAEKQWKKLLADETLAAIFHYTQCHSYYLNVLCSYLFEKKQAPTINEVKKPMGNSLSRRTKYTRKRYRIIDC